MRPMQLSNHTMIIIIEDVSRVNHYSYLDCPSSPSYYAFSNSSTNGICVQYCPGNTFSLDSNRTCVTVCPVLYFVNYTLNLIINQCVARCPSNTYKNSTSYCVNATNCPTG